MPRYKHIDMSPRLLPVDLSADSFEHVLRQLIDHEPDLCAFEIHYRNDSVGAFILTVRRRFRSHQNRTTIRAGKGGRRWPLATI